MEKNKTTGQLLSQSKFAKLCRVSAEAIRKACIAGKIDIEGEGRKKKIIIDGPNTVDYLHDKNSQRVKPKSSELPAAAIVKTESAALPGDQLKNHTKIETRPQAPRNNFSLSDENLNLNDLSATDIKKMKDLEAAKKSMQERMKSRGELIERNLVKAVLGRVYTVEVNQIKPVADKAPAKIAAIFENDDSEKILAVSQLLSKELGKALEHIQHVLDKFLSDIDDTKDVQHYVS